MIDFIKAEIAYHELSGLVTCLITLMGVICIVGIALVINGEGR